MTAHAVLGASSTSRWMTCPGSVRLSEGMPDVQSGVARLGSAAHSLAEVCLLQGEAPFEYLDEVHPDPDYEDIPVDVDMIDAVSVYVDHIRAYGLPIDESNIEVRVSLSRLGDWAKDLFGTADFLGQDRAVMLVDDYKHGQGVGVEVEDNTQFKYYAVGALMKLRNPRDVKQVRTTVIQPRKAHNDGPVRPHVYGVQELLDWAEKDLKQAVLATREPDAPLVPSEKACMFCRAKGICPALQKKCMSDALLDFDEGGSIVPSIDKDKLTPEQVTQVLKSEKLVQKWFAAVAELANQSLARGTDITGGTYKLVAGRSSRSWKDDEAAEKQLLALDHNRSALYTEKFISVAQAEKLVGKTQKTKLSDLISTTEGKATLAPVEDKRPALVQGPEDDFLGS